MSNEGNNGLTPDTALESIDEDQLGYADFALQLSDVLTTRIPTNGYTVGIHGRWGAGKSTVLNFVEDCLRDEDNSPVIVRFNPWWFSGQADLTEKFLNQLGTELGAQGSFQNIRENLARLSLALSSIPFEQTIGVPLGPGFSAVHSLLQQDEETIDELKQEIGAELEAANEKVIVIIDDIDRLTPREVTQMLQLIKSVTDFPNVAYVLAFDRNIVAEALEKEQAVRDGNQYLRKIIQLPLPIPLQKSGALKSLFTQRLRDIPGDYVVDDTRWQSLLDSGVMPVLDTPRDVLRLGNTVDVMYTAIGDEVNFIDLVGLETLRVFYGEIYETIRSDSKRFTGHRSHLRRPREEPDEYLDLLNDIEDSEKREAVESILKILFPKVRYNLMDSYSTGHNWRQKKVERRICHRDTFPIYFRLNIPDYEMTTAEISALMSQVGDSQEFAEELENLIEADNQDVDVFISHFSDRVNEIEQHDIDPAIKSLLAVGDRLVENSSFKPATRPQEAHNLSLILMRLLHKQDEDERTNTLASAISDGDSPYLASFLVWELRSQHDGHGIESRTSENPVLTMEDLEQLEPIIANEIGDAAEENRLLNMHSIRVPLSQWSRWSDSSEPQDWVDRLIDTDEGLLTFIDAISSTTLLGGSDPASYLDPQWMDDYLSRDDVRERLHSIEQSELDEESEEIIERFDRGEEFLANGQDASSVEVWFHTGSPSE